MKIIFLILLMIPSFAKSEPLDFKDKDKQLHFIASFAITNASYLVYKKGLNYSKEKSLLLAITTSLAIGTLKELSDPTFSGADLAADSIGTSVGILIPLCFEF